MIRTDMDYRLLKRTVELAKKSRLFDYKKLPKTLRVAIDSAPLEGAGRVEDTINLLWHAARKIVAGLAVMMDSDPETICRAAQSPLLLGPAPRLPWTSTGATGSSIKRPWSTWSTNWSRWWYG